MSYREVRDFIEHLRALGYNGARLTPTSFIVPSFPLISECALFLIKRIDPSAASRIDADISTPAKRIAFAAAIITVCHSAVGIVLSVRNIFRADARAVRELSRVSGLLYAAAKQTDAANTTADAVDVTALSPSAVSAVIDGVSGARGIGNEVVDIGARIFTRADDESAVRTIRARARAVSQQHNAETDALIESAIRRHIVDVEARAAELSAQTADAQREHVGAASKAERRTVELVRAEKRWNQLAAVKPQYVADVEAAERELRRLHTQYVQRFRNVDFLNATHSAIASAEQTKRRGDARQIKRMQKALRIEELRNLRRDGGDGDDEDDDDDDDSGDDDDERTDESVGDESASDVGSDESVGGLGAADSVGGFGAFGGAADDDDDADSDTDTRRNISDRLSAGAGDYF